MQPKTFYYDTLNTHNLKLSNKKQYGLIAQDVEKILPELTSITHKPADVDSSGTEIFAAFNYKSLNYNAFIAILIKGMQEQQKTINSLTGKTTKQDSINTALQNQLNNLACSMDICCSSSSSKSLSQSNSIQTIVELSNSQTVVLAQNVPNPFAEQTSINYFLPDNTVKAQMLFYDARGILIKAVDLSQTGNGSLNVFAQDLTTGIYSYTLVVDGKIVETKRMVKK